MGPNDIPIFPPFRWSLGLRVTSALWASCVVVSALQPPGNHQAEIGSTLKGFLQPNTKTPLRMVWGDLYTVPDIVLYMHVYKHVYHQYSMI